MSKVVTNTYAAPNFEKLKAKLRELFELDKADLDFGIYRILRQRHAEITEFLDKHLEKTVHDALTSHGVIQIQQVKQDLETAEEDARRLGVAPEQSPLVLELRAKYKAGTALDATASEVYSHLFTFFSRYYQEGDFIGLPRATVQGREKYMIPYNGEEVKLIWANMDQYYIKSSEALRDYTFRIRRADLNIMQPDLLVASNDEPEEVVIHFKLVEGDTEKDNRKLNGKTTRAFTLDVNQPFAQSDAATIIIHFRYQEHPSEQNLQRNLNVLTEKVLADTLPPKWQRFLLASDPIYKGKDTLSLLQKHLRDYTARHQFDYFIHKDLGSFLRRELDFYIKNEVMHLDDIENLTAAQAEEYLSKIRALKSCALPVIRMLAQLENFQKKLWLKKKFVVETRYCLTLDHVPGELYEEILANDAQWTEWEQLYAISEIEKNLPSAKARTLTFMRQHPHLMLDTYHFSREFTLKLLASIDNLDKTLNGVCFHSENFQALQLIQARYWEQVKCIHIDPPYNTGTSGFLYRNDYQHSSWLAMMEDRISSSKTLLSDNGSFLCHIDENEYEHLHALFNNHSLVDAGTIVWDKRNPMNGGLGVATQHEYIICRTNQQEPIYLRNSNISLILEKAKQLIEAEGAITKNVRKQFSAWVNSNDQLSGGEKAYRYIDNDGTIYQSVSLRAPEPREDPKFHQPLIHPVTKKPCAVPPNGFSRTPDTLQTMIEHGEILFGKDETTQPRQKVPLTENTKRQLSSLIQNAKKGKADLIPLGVNFPYCHPTSLYEELIGAISHQTDDIILDFFAGSGTTGHAVINLNREIINLDREDSSLRKYILVEVGEYIETVLVPRLKKVVYSTDWRNGKPQRHDIGISHAFKIVRLESYEDTLNNLYLHRTPLQEQALQQANEQQRIEYLLGYFLEVESAGSSSLLDVKQFRDPFSYQMQIATSSAGETKATRIDLVETFNWLLGLKVEHIETQEDFLTVTGEQRTDGRTLIIWRTLSDDLEGDNIRLEKYLSELELNPADTEFDFIYVNGSHTLHDPHKKIHLIEEVFQRRMFESETFDSLR